MFLQRTDCINGSDYINGPEEVKEVVAFAQNKSQEKKAEIERIILENYNQYYRLAYSYTHAESDACDIVQNGAYKALRNFYALKKIEYAKTWVYRIMLNECFSFLKHPRLLSLEAAREMGKTQSAAEDRYADLDLRNALDALPKKDKAVVILKYFEDKKLEEIAEILDENISTVKSRLYRNMKKLRKTLARGTEEDRGDEFC